jgi:hypothetical protein
MPLIYAPLPKGNYIRLLEVREGFLSHELVCKFNVVCLDDCKEDYTAISYAWGNQSSPTTTVKFSDGQTLSLSATLSSLFTSLRKKQRSFTVWIDAICINQQDTAEKSSQVALMGDVYSRAEEVLLWLGDETPETHEAFRFMESKQTWSWPEDWDSGIDSTELQSMFSILGRAYFQRVWVVQEVTLNGNVVMACDDQRIDFDNFRHCVFAVWKFFEGWESLDDDSDEVRGLYCATRMIFIRDEWQDLGAVRFEILLQAALHCKATDARDMVFAFRGIGGRDRPVPEPDYEASVEDVFTKTATALLCHGPSLDFLALSGTACREMPSNLPSWVADLSQHSWSEPFVPCDRGSWDTGGPLQVTATISPPNRLRLQVRVFDAVAVDCPPFNSHSVPEQKAAVEQALSLKNRLPYDTSDDEWLQTVAWSLIFGLDIDDQPAGAEYLDYFSSWLEWLQSSSSQADLVKIQGNKYHRTVGPRIDSWKAFMTERGSFCIGPPKLEVGDIVCVVPGCRFPLLLRASRTLDEGASLPSYILVSWCFVQGIMKGEAVTSGEILDLLLE